MSSSNFVTTGRRHTAQACAVLALALALAGCGSSSAGGGGEGLSSGKVEAANAAAAAAAQAPTKISETTPLSTKPPIDKLIVFVGGTTPPDAEHLAGIEDAAKLLGWQTKSFTFDAANISTFNTAMLQALRENPDYVVESGIAEDQFSKSTVAEYRAAGVPIIPTNVTPVPTEDPFVPLPAGTNAFLAGGEILANWFVGDSEGRGKILVVNITAYPILTAFADRFEKKVAETCPSCSTTKLSQTFSDLVGGAIPANVVSKLRADPSIKYVVFDNSAEANGLDAALKAAGLDDIKAAGWAIDAATIKSLESGQAKAFVAYNFRYNGWASVDAAARLSVGDPLDNSESVAPYWLITPDNVDQMPADAVFRGPDDALDQFAKLWLVAGP